MPNFSAQVKSVNHPILNHYLEKVSLGKATLEQALKDAVIDMASAMNAADKVAKVVGNLPEGDKEILKTVVKEGVKAAVKVLGKNPSAVEVAKALKS